MKIVYDGSFDGLMTAFFYAYAHKVNNPVFETLKNYQPSLFADDLKLETNLDKADRIIQALKQKTGKQFHHFFYAFHNDRDQIEMNLFEYIQIIFSVKYKKSTDYSHPAVLKIAQLARSVSREKHRMEAFVRFQLTKDDIYFASITPDFDVIPLIQAHFKERFGDQQWIIYDLKRNYGIYYNLQNVQSIALTFVGGKESILQTSTAIFADEEIAFQQLWANYFKSTNIPSRKNMKLHLQHVPKRYWKYLSEKQVL